MGETGKTGNYGAIGPTGFRGDTGFIGLIGEQGNIGFNGSDGSTGEKGTRGLNNVSNTLFNFSFNYNDINIIGLERFTNNTKWWATPEYMTNIKIENLIKDWYGLIPNPIPSVIENYFPYNYSTYRNIPSYIISYNKIRLLLEETIIIVRFWDISGNLISLDINDTIKINIVVFSNLGNNNKPISLSEETGIINGNNVDKTLCGNIVFNNSNIVEINYKDSIGVYLEFNLDPHSNLLNSSINTIELYLGIKAEVKIV